MSKLKFIDELLLESELAKDLFQKTKDLPIIDYHNHLSPEILANNKNYLNITDLWISGDHYKWRAMRQNGVPEEFCSGNADDYEKFIAWAKTSSKTLRNPLYHWNALELFSYFDISEELNETNAKDIWERTNEKIKSDALLPQSILEKNKVKILCTTDDPADSLKYHKKLKDDNHFKVSVLPTFRPDGACYLDGTQSFLSWLNKLKEVSDCDITNFNEFLMTLRKRHNDFHEMGCRISDHGLETIFSKKCSKRKAETIFNRLLDSKDLSTNEIKKWRSYLMKEFAAWNHSKGWTMLLHLGALRNNNTKIYNKVGLGTGCDSIGDFSHAKDLNKFFNELNNKDSLPKTIIFNSNPNDNMIFSTIAGNFFEDEIKGKIQFGPAWWFLDTSHGIEEQFNAMSLVSLASNFVGMVTDSRSFLSFSRHEYFRRIICNLYAKDVKNNYIPNDPDKIIDSLESIFYSNAFNYFNWDEKND